jgi:hypothetical protein
LQIGNYFGTTRTGLGTVMRGWRYKHYKGSRVGLKPSLEDVDGSHIDLMGMPTSLTFLMGRSGRCSGFLLAFSHDYKV